VISASARFLAYFDQTLLKKFLSKYTWNKNNLGDAFIELGYTVFTVLFLLWQCS
jgi:hypothetical protein